MKDASHFPHKIEQRLTCWQSFRVHECKLSAERLSDGSQKQSAGYGFALRLFWDWFLFKTGP